MLYASFDIEADGPCPLKNSMLSFGVVIYDQDGNEIDSFERNLFARTDAVEDIDCLNSFWKQHPDQWDYVHTNQISPRQFVRDFVKFLNGRSVIWIAYPAAYDWQWLNNYYHLYRDASDPDLGYSAKCISTLFWV